MSRSVVKREQTHTRVAEVDFLAGFKVEAFSIDDDTALCLGCLVHIESCRRVACAAAAFECAAARLFAAHLIRLDHFLWYENDPSF